MNNAARLYLRVLVLCLSGIGIAACSSTGAKVSCQETDWYEIGRAEGTAGKAPRNRKTVEPICKGSDATVVKALYENGHSSGNSEFCRKEILFDLGYSGQRYNYVCPAAIEHSMLQSYFEGKRMRELEGTHEKIFSDLEKINRVLLDSQLTAPELGYLQTKKSELTRQQQALQIEIDRMGNPSSSKN